MLILAFIFVKYGYDYAAFVHPDLRVTGINMVVMHGATWWPD